MTKAEAITVCLMIGFVVLPFSAVEATQVLDRPLPDLVKEAEHILVGRVTKVEMVDETGRELTDPESRTGPGIENELRLHIKVEEVLRSNRTDVPSPLVIPLWQMWHFSLGQWKEEEGATNIFLLKGPKYETVYPMLFRRSLSDREEIDKLLGKP